jgi:hypothetical protein
MTRRGPRYVPDPVAVGVFDGLRAEYLAVGEALASARSDVES